MLLDVNSLRSAKSDRIFCSGKDMDVDDQDLSSIPAHVSIVKDGLLDFNRFLGLEAIMLVLGDEESSEDDRDVIPLCAYKTDGLKTSQRAREREFLENAKQLAEGAQRLGSEFAEDGDEWRTLFRNIITNRIDDFHCFNSHQLSTIACAENELWDTNLDPSRCQRTNPQPDLCFGFPLRNAECHKLPGFWNDPSVQNFTVNTLFQLAIKGLRCVPVSRSLARVLEMKRDSTELQAPLLCFPWCIVQLQGAEKVVEAKKNYDPALKISRKASAAATSALAMIETLAKFADVKQDGQHIPPVITITSAGPNTTVWLAYSDIVDDQYRDHKMVSIWNGCISKIWDAIQFCRIVDNLFSWSQQILRPKVSHYIDQWRFRKSNEAHKLYSQLEKDLETAELVHRIEDRLTSLSISPNSNLPQLIQHAVILQEVIGSTQGKTESAPKEIPNSKAETEIRISNSFPSHLKVNISTVGAPVDKIMEEGIHEESTFKEESIFKEEENRKGEDDMDGGTEDNDIYGSNGAPLQPNPPKKNAASIRPPVNKHFSNSDSPPSLSNDEKTDKEPSFWYPFKFRISDFEFDQTRFLSRSPEPRSTYFGERNASHNLAPVTYSNSCSLNTDSSSGLPGPFKCRSFEPRPSSAPRKNTTSSSRDAKASDSRRTLLSEPLKNGKLAGQIAQIPKQPSSRVRIPWKEGRFITVRLPPVVPVMPSRNRPDPFSTKYSEW